MNAEDIDYTQEKVLVADDETEFAEILRDLLHHKGFKAHFVTNGDDALSELQKDTSYTFLITDIIMPGLDGLHLTETVAAEFSNVATIVMTGYTNGYKYVDVINAGAIDFINKPFRIEELEAKIRRGIIERNTRAELKRLTITDSLTGLFNQRHFYSRLKDEIIRSQRQDLRLALMLLDLDNFKNYNDKNGHIAGDALLQKFSKIISRQIRQGVDSGYRYGGDEFAVILVDADESICRDIGKRIEKVFRDECDEGVTMGYSTFKEGMSTEDFIAEADKYLYAVKGIKKQDDTGH